jgi:hypothetical protein
MPEKDKVAVGIRSHTTKEACDILLGAYKHVFETHIHDHDEAAGDEWVGVFRRSNSPIYIHRNDLCMRGGFVIGTIVKKEGSVLTIDCNGGNWHHMEE